MDDDAKQEEKIGEFTQGSGSILAAERKKQQKTIEEIAGELNLSVTQVKTIELDQSEGLPEPTYVRGYIRGYAKLLGLKPEEVLQNYLNPNWQQTSSLNDIPRGIGNAQEEKRSIVTPGKVISVLLLAAIIFFAWSSGLVSELLSGKTEPQQNELVQSSSLDAGADRTSATNVAQASNSELLNSDAGSDDSDGVSGNVAATPAGDAVVEATSVPQEPSPLNSLLVTFSETSWIDIRDQEDQRLAYKSYVQGEELKVESDGALSVFIGNASGVSVQLNGQAFDIEPHREGVYAKFVINDEQ